MIFADGRVLFEAYEADVAFQREMARRGGWTGREGEGEKVAVLMVYWDRLSMMGLFYS